MTCKNDIYIWKGSLQNANQKVILIKLQVTESSGNKIHPDFKRREHFNQRFVQTKNT